MTRPAASPARRGEAIRVNVTVPGTRLGFGPFSIDPLEQLIGAKLADLLEPVMVGPVCRRPSEAGAAIEVYPLALPDGEGASIPLGQWGEVGFRNAGGLLVITVPWGMAGWLRQKLGDAIVRGPSRACRPTARRAWRRHGCGCVRGCGRACRSGRWGSAGSSRPDDLPHSGGSRLR